MLFSIFIYCKISLYHAGILSDSGTKYVYMYFTGSTSYACANPCKVHNEIVFSKNIDVESTSLMDSLVVISS